MVCRSYLRSWRGSFCGSLSSIFSGSFSGSRCALGMAWSPAMPRKRPRPDVDVERLAAEFRRCWGHAEAIEPWLRRNASRLRGMVRNEGWSWADIGRAMTLAGITYSGGKPWTRKVLTVKMAQARSQLQRRKAGRTAGALPRSRQAAPPAAVAPTMRPATGPEIDSNVQPEPAACAVEPAFQLARAPAARVVPSSGPPRPAPVPQRRDPDEVIAELLSRPKLGSVPMPAVPHPDEDE